jgi:hypothetical protein
MSDCCSDGACEASTANNTTTTCPNCQQTGKHVDTQIVKSMLKGSLHSIQDSTNYYFCRTPDCYVVYFNEDGEQTYATIEVRERVFQKEPDASDVHVCYCFQHSPASIREEIIKTGNSTVVAEINTAIKAGKCACDIRNPQGTCCLGNVQQVVKALVVDRKTE